MKCYFDSIEDFFKIKESCVFCGGKLEIIFINFSRSSNDVPIIKSKEKDGKFQFHMKHTTPGFELEANVEIDIRTNLVKFDLLNKEDRSTEILDCFLVQETFENLGPHIELYCPSRSCGLNYCISSDNFRCDSVPNEPSVWKIRSVRLYMESFVVDNLWVQNDWIFNSTNIYLRDNANTEPLRTKIMNLEGMGRDKIITRIKTLVTFS
jgi:hypothetical protein